MVERTYTEAEARALAQAAGEAMREACADYVAECLAELGLPLGVASIRAFPLPTPDLDAIRAQANAIEDERLNPWKAAIINAMICMDDLPRAGETPREALNRHIAREQEIALDPTVSQAARDLVEQAWREGMERAIEAVNWRAACRGDDGYDHDDLMLSARDAEAAIRAAMENE